MTEQKKTLSRRRFIIATGIGAAALVSAAALPTFRGGVLIQGQTGDGRTFNFGPALQQPDTLRPVDGVLNTVFNLQKHTNVISGPSGWFNGDSTATLDMRSYGVPTDPNNPFANLNFGFPAPTFRLGIGDTLNLQLLNGLAPNQFPGQCNSVSGEPGGGNRPPAVSFPNCFHENETTNIHTHGLHVSPNRPSDDVLLNIEPGISFDYSYLIDKNQAPGSHWYHPHKHGSTAFQMANGMGGMLIVEGQIDQWPGIAEAQDVQIILQKVGSDPDSPLGNPPGLISTINGQVQPRISLHPGEVQRWRILTATNREERQAEGFKLFLVELTGSELPVVDTLPNVDNKAINPILDPDAVNLIPMHQIAADGVQFSDIVTVSDEITSDAALTLAPANRADVLVQFPTPDNWNSSTDRRVFALVDINFKADDELSPSEFPGLQQTLAFVVIEGQPMEMELPTSLPPLPFFLRDVEDAEIIARRHIVFAMNNLSSSSQAQGTTGFFINDAQFDANRVDQKMILGTGEEWILENSTDWLHPFHIHINPFQVIGIETDESGFQPVAPNLRWQDTINIPNRYLDSNGVFQTGKVKIRHRFIDFTGKYVFHCHNLGHEDNGMMQIVEVSDSGLPEGDLG